MRCKNFVFEELAEQARDPKDKALYKAMKLYNLVLAMRNPLVLELGVAKGLSTCLIGTALETVGGHLVSVDIRDCSDVIESARWTFVHSDDLDHERVLRAAPDIQDGIDLLYLDSRHTATHVVAQLMTWFPYAKQGGLIAFDDVDPAPYEFGGRKQDYRLARDCEGIGQAVRKFFLANEDSLRLEVHLGSTGLAIITKFSPLGTRPNPPRVPRRWPLHLVVRGRLDALVHQWRAPSRGRPPAQPGH
jgi:predicted O-methyltransferase YrrM